MKVRMKTSARGPSFEANVGDVVDVSNDMARDLLNGGYAEAVEPVVEAAVVPEPVEAAVRPRRKARRKTV